MRRELDKRRRMAWRSLFKAFSRIHQKIDQDLERAGVGSMVEYDVLYTLYESPERRVRLAELADAVFISRSGLTRLVDRLERSGYIHREASQEDRRGIYAVLTDAGIEKLRTIWEVYAPGISQYFGSHLSDTEADVILTLFTRLEEAQESSLAPSEKL